MSRPESEDVSYTSLWFEERGYTRVTGDEPRLIAWWESPRWWGATLFLLADVTGLGLLVAYGWQELYAELWRLITLGNAR